MHARIIIVPDLALALSVAVAGVALSLTGYAWDGWSTMPVAIRFAAGLIVFGLSPGLLIAGPLLAGRSRTVGPADFVISVFTCSFSCNLIFNIVLFLSDVSFADLAHAYVVAQALGYVLWGAWAWRGRRERALAGEPARTVEVHGAMLFSGLVLTIAAAALTYIAYANGPPPVNPEELVSLRKLAENPTVRYDNLFFRNGDPSTYLFVPFQILIVGTSLLAHLDVVLTYSLFWGVTTALSIAILTRLAFLMFGRAEVAAVVCLTMMLIGFFDPRSVIFDAGIVTPYPNATVCQGLLTNLASRGLRTDRSLLVIVDGAKALETAVTQTFGRAAVVQRCQVHKGRNILEHLPEAQRPWVKAILTRAYTNATVKTAKRLLQDLARRLDTDHPSAAASVRRPRRDADRARLGPVGTPPTIARHHERHRESAQPHAPCEAQCETLARWDDGAAVGGRRRARSREGVPPGQRMSRYAGARRRPPGA